MMKKFAALARRVAEKTQQPKDVEPKEEEQQGTNNHVEDEIMLPPTTYFTAPASRQGLEVDQEAGIGQLKVFIQDDKTEPTAVSSSEFLHTFPFDSETDIMAMLMGSQRACSQPPPPSEITSNKGGYGKRRHYIHCSLPPTPIGRGRMKRFGGMNDYMDSLSKTLRKRNKDICNGNEQPKHTGRQGKGYQGNEGKIIKEKKKTK